ncbi:MAG: hypothetical protein ACODAU_06730 [Myxococcota bacterium]
MGAGSLYLLMYALCCAGVAFTGALAGVLYVLGRRAERRREETREHPPPLDPSSTDG